MNSWNRRRVLQAAVTGACAALWPVGRLFAQGAPASLLRAKKEALVIGNGKYRNAPLRNPVNDARDVAETLKQTGFEVLLGLELTREEMRSAIAAYGKSLAASKAVGLFYFAGHGAQLAWRNYLLPVDGEIASVEELREHGVDVNSLIDGIRRAGNPMNLIILDACRDNPFGSLARVEQKGLSQLDAPPGTLLAYATAPGNTAIDGEGRNGLYTEHLLREMKVPEAKVEDVFKRVRLSVRRRSNGMQIPWESTSLEDDFWFVPPRGLRKDAAADIEREFAEELALWERIRDATQPEPLETYLRSYPSGRFSELAQLQLDRILAKLGEKKVAVVSAPENPYSKGTFAADTAYKVGDFYSYRRMDLLTRLEMKRVNLRVTEITEHEVRFNDGRFVTDHLGNNLRFGGGMVWSANQTVPTEFAVGKRWSCRFQANPPKGGTTVVELDLRIADRERIVVPAGNFNAFRVEAKGWQTGLGGSRVRRLWDWKTWYSPAEVRQPVAFEWLNTDGGGRILRSQRDELVEFRQS